MFANLEKRIRGRRELIEVDARAMIRTTPS
jgi:hypothetical protein